MTLFRITYVSQVARPVRYKDAEEIATRSAVRNKVVGITGMLLYTPSHFVQVLEGSEGVVRKTFARIAEDPRHHTVRIVAEERCDEREFGAWAMQVTRVPAELRQGLGGLDGASARALLQRCIPQPG